MNSNFHPAGSSALRIAAAAILLAGLCARASADDSFFSAPANPNTVRAGIYLVHYSASAPDLSGPYTPAGINLRVEHVNTPYLAYLRDFNNHWTFELAAGIPPTTHTYGVGPDKVGSVPFNGQEVATAKWFAPTFLLEYNFFDHAAAFRPFVGAGMNYTHFYDRKSTAAGNAANGGPTTTDLSDSVGPAGTAGAVYKFTDQFHVIASYSIAQIKSDYKSDTSGIIRRTTVNFHPTTWVLAVGYSF